MTTITRLKQLKALMTGQEQPERIAKNKEVGMQALLAHIRLMDDLTTDRFASYRNKIMPKLQASGYVYFLACASNDYQDHEEWCQINCKDFTLPHCDVWQFDQQYPRAFASQADAMLFCLTFDACEIGAGE